MTEFELSPFRMTEAFPALWICGERGNIIPTDRFIGPAQCFCHRTPHGETDRREYGLCTCIRDEEYPIAVSPDAIGFVHPGLITWTPDNWLTIAIQDRSLRSARGNMSHRDKDCIARSDFVPLLIELCYDRVHPILFCV